MKYSIHEVNESLLYCLPHKEQPFEVIGKLIPIYDGEDWHMKEELFVEPYQQTFPNDIYNPRIYRDSDVKTAFVAILDNKCIGSIRVSKRWNSNAFIDDIHVDREYRGIGIGTYLMDKAVAWSKEKGLNGISLETQDNNLLACRFYLKYGFKLGGMDNLIYTVYPYCNFKALYFYLY